MTNIDTRTLRPFAGNVDVFRDLAGDEYAELRDSIRVHGVITPLVVTQDNVLIAGHQRLRAARELGLETVPCVVRHVADDTELELLLIEDNVRRRHLSPYEFAKAVKRAYELNGIRAGNQVNKNDCAGVAQLAESYGVSERTIKTARTLAELVPAFGEMLDAKQITKEVAYQIAQLPADAQMALYDNWDDNMKHIRTDVLKSLKEEYQDTLKKLGAKAKEAEECAKRYEAELADAKRALDEADEPGDAEVSEVRAQIEAEYESQIEKLNDELVDLHAQLREALKVKAPEPAKPAQKQPTPTKPLGPATSGWNTDPAPRDGTLLLTAWADGEIMLTSWDSRHKAWDFGDTEDPTAWAHVYKPGEEVRDEH